MDTQDHTETNPSSGLEGHHEVHLCHRCGWPFPNPLPSSRHRRAHKKICGTIEGYTLEQPHHLAVSDDENHSDDDDDHKTPSPKIEEKKRSTDEFGSGGIGERSGRSEDEVFSDAVTEFSESGISPEGGEKLVAVRDSDKNVDKDVEGDLDSSPHLKIVAISGATEPGKNLPIESSEVDVVVVESSEREVKDVKNIEKDGVDNVIPDAGEPAEDRGCESSDSEIKLSEAKVVESVDIEVKVVKKIENDEVDNVIADAGEPVKDTICESSDPDIKLHEAKLQDTDRDISDSLGIETKDSEPDKGTICESSDSEIKSQETKLQDRDGDISDSLGISNDKPSVQVLSVLSHDTESVVLVPATSTIVQTKADFDHGVDGHDHGDMSEVSNTKDQVDEAVRILSVSDLPVVDHSDTLIEGNQEDNGGIKSEIPVILESAKIIMPVEDGNKDTKPEINSSADVDPVAEEKEEEKIQGNTSAEGLQSVSSENMSSLDTISSHAQTDLSGASPMVTLVQEEVNSSTKLSEDGIGDDCEIEKSIPDRDESNDGVAEKQNSEVSKSTLEPIERLIENEVEQDSIIQEESDVGNQENLGQEHSSKSPVERTETIFTDNCAGNTNEKKEAEEVSTEMGTDANELGNVIQKHPNSLEDQHEVPKEVAKEDQIDDIVSDMASENVIKKEPELLLKDMETSRTVEDSYKGDSLVVSKPAVEEGNDKMINQQHGIDTSVHSSSQNSVEGNWGSVSEMAISLEALAKTLNEPQEPEKVAEKAPQEIVRQGELARRSTREKRKEKSPSRQEPVSKKTHTSSSAPTVGLGVNPQALDKLKTPEFAKEAANFWKHVAEQVTAMATYTGNRLERVAGAAESYRQNMERVMSQRNELILENSLLSSRCGGLTSALNRSQEECAQLRRALAKVTEMRGVDGTNIAGVCIKKAFLEGLKAGVADPALHASAPTLTLASCRLPPATVTEVIQFVDAESSRILVPADAAPAEAFSGEEFKELTQEMPAWLEKAKLAEKSKRTSTADGERAQAGSSQAPSNDAGKSAVHPSSKDGEQVSKKNRRRRLKKISEGADVFVSEDEGPSVL